MFYDTWLLEDWISIEGGLPPLILWTGRASDPVPPDQAYACFTMTPVTANQSSLAGGDGEKKWSNQGIINVQTFAPLQWVDAYEVAEYMGIIAKRVYQGKASPNGVWFRNCRTNRIGPSGGWYQFNTLIEYQFDELR